MPDTHDDWRPGRSCPLHYRYLPKVFARAPDLVADTLYIVGGLYGNPFALSEILDMAAREPGPTALVFNGDFNWFDVEAATFEAVNRTVLAHTALRGNVETELASDDSAGGCGCGYPDSVSDADVARSNAILEQLRGTSLQFPELRARLSALPMHAVAQVGGLRIGIVHGDAESLAGWGFDAKALDDATQRGTLDAWFDAARVDGFASSHTCLPALRKYSGAADDLWVINNGAAGMPNFSGTAFGVVTRIATRPPAPRTSLYGFQSEGAAVDALPVRYDQTRWLEYFLAAWPPGTPAHASYHARIVHGPAYSPEQAAPRGAPQQAA